MYGYKYGWNKKLYLSPDHELHNKVEKNVHKLRESAWKLVGRARVFIKLIQWKLTPVGKRFGYATLQTNTWNHKEA